MGGRRRRAVGSERERSPVQRPRRLRRTPALRRLVAETRSRVDDLVAPLFVREGIDEPQPIASLPGVVQHTRESLRKEVAELADLGVPGGDPVRRAGPQGPRRQRGLEPRRHRAAGAARPARTRSATASCSWPTAASTSTPTTATAACSPPTGEVDNDATLELYARAAVAQAEAGAHVVAPSGMMDGQVAAIRAALDGAGHDDTAILAYSAKYASALYGPFRDAVDVQIAGGGDRKGYQQDWRNAREALVEVRADIEPGCRHGDGQAGPRLPRRDRRACAPRSTCRSRPTTCPASTR